MRQKLILDAFIQIVLRPKSRPRSTHNRNGKLTVYTPPRTCEFEEKLGWLVKAAYKDRPTSQKLKIELTLHFRKSMRGDIDNYTKSILDAMNKIVYDDDRQIRHKTVSVVDNCGHDGVHIQVWEISNEVI